MAVAPLLKPIQTRKGILYTFQSASEDLNLTLNNTSANGFKFTKFALLRIPEMTIPSTITTDNVTQFIAQGETPIVNNTSNDQNINLAMSFQSYALNFESLLISQDSYDSDKKLTVSERVFWKWLKELGAIRWRPSNNSEIPNILSDELPRYSEDWYDQLTSTYNRVVKYIGEIDAVNSIKSNSNSYTELYIHIPTTVGMTPTVLFKSVPDQNYGPNMVIVNTPGDPLDLEYLHNRHYNDSHPYAGMSLRAFYDLDTNIANTYISDTLNDSPNELGFWWGTTIVNNAYYTDKASVFGSPYGNTTISNPKTQRIKKEYTSGQNARKVQYLRSTHDGMTLDFEISNYLLASQNSEVNSFSQLNETYGSSDFEYNAILIYYDVYDINPSTNLGTEPAFQTNLFGVYFLNKVEQTGSEFIIPMINKYMPDPINKINGNAFAYKVNLKLDSITDETAVEKSINDYNTFSLDLYLDVLTEMKLLQTKFNDKLLELEQLSSSLQSTRDLISNSTVLSDLDTRIKQLENTIYASINALDNTDSILQLIDETNSRLDSVFNGSLPKSFSYDVSVFKQGYGIEIDRSVKNQLKISNTTQMYSNINLIDISTNVQGIFNTYLGISNTYVKHQKLNQSGESVPYTLNRNITIILDDSINSWKTGQSVKLTFDSQIIPGNYTITIKTDSNNLTNSISRNSVTVATLTSSDFTTTFGRTGTPIIDILCINSKTLSFSIDKIIR